MDGKNREEARSEPASEGHSQAKVVVAVELDDEPRARTLAAAARRFGGDGATLRLVHVHQIRQTAVLDFTYVEPPERLAKELDEANAKLDALSRSIAGPTEVAVLVGPPAETLLADAPGAALVVIGRTHKGLIERALGATVEAKLVHEAPCPVLVVP